MPLIVLIESGWDTIYRFIMTEHDNNARTNVSKFLSACEMDGVFVDKEKQ